MRHHDVRQDEVEVRPLLQQLDGLHAVDLGQRGVACRVQDLPHQVAHILLVVDDENQAFRRRRSHTLSKADLQQCRVSARSTDRAVGARADWILGIKATLLNRNNSVGEGTDCTIG